MPSIFVTDAFDGSGALNGTAVGTSTTNVWNVISGTWSRSGGFASATEAPSASPFAVTDIGTADTYVYCNGGPGDAVYFRVQDQNNWWRLRSRTYTYTSNEYKTSGSAYLQETDTWQSGSNGYDLYSSGSHVYSTVNAFGGGTINTEYGYVVSRSPTSITVQIYVQPVYHPTETDYYLVLEANVNGTIYAVFASTEPGPGYIKVGCAGSGIETFASDGVTVRTYVSNTFLQTATKHGIGKGGSDGTSYTSSLDNFGLYFAPPSELVSVWDGSTEHAGSMTLWDGAAEQPLNVRSWDGSVEQT